MCKPGTNRIHPWYSTSVLLPIVSGLLHLNTCFRAYEIMLCTSPSLPPFPDMRDYMVRLELSGALAYCFDLVCCYGFSVIPFSRCRKARDIAMHHLPILLVCQPLLVPVLMQWTWLDPTVLNILQNSGETAYMYVITTAIGFSSSMNEAIMSFQRAELSLDGKEYIDDDTKDSSMKGRIRIFTSTRMQLFEMCYKVYIFAVCPLFAFISLFRADRIFFEAQSHLPLSQVIYSYVTSPCKIRCFIYRLFMILLYPKMGKRAVQRTIRLYSKVRSS